MTPDDEVRRKELEYRGKEVSYQRAGLWTGSIAAGVGLITAVAALVAAVQAVRAVNTAQEAVLLASREQRMTSGIEAMGGETPAQRIAGIGLLSRSVAIELKRVTPEGVRIDADNLTGEQEAARAAYLSTIDALENYIGSWRQSASAATPTPTATPTSTPTVAPTGTPSSLRGQEPRRRAAEDTEDEEPPPFSEIADYFVPKDVIYAGNELRLRLLDPDLRPHARMLDGVPSVDLAGAALWGVPWSGFDPSWLTGYDFARIDLRGATLTGSRWGLARLADARLQCAELSEASFANRDTTEKSIDPGANLQGADLRGAMLFRADLRGANLEDADLRGAVLGQADLRGALLAGARFNRAGTRGIRLAGAVDRDLAFDLVPGTVADPEERDLRVCLARYWDS